MKWQGRCFDCQSWGTLRLISKSPGRDHEKEEAFRPSEAVRLSDVPILDIAKYSTGISEFDRILGGGIVPGSLVLIGGDPGIGKSSLVLQAAARLKGDVILVSGEETVEQIKTRAKRLAISMDHLWVAADDEVEAIVQLIKNKKPALAIIDSIQTVFSHDVSSEPGSVNQVKAACLRFLEVSKSERIPIWLIGHVTKDGSLGGPKTLEHYVDTVIMIEGDDRQGLRTLRPLKNRFGSTKETGFFEMTERGLQEVKNPSSFFYHQREKPVPGSIHTVVMEGTRPIVIEIQALVNRTAFGIPQRKCTGFDRNRLDMIVAVIEKHQRMSFSSLDVVVNVVAGIFIADPSADLAVACALASAKTGLSYSKPTIAIGEIGLAGEVRAVNGLQERIFEGKNLGFQRFFCPKSRDVSASANNAIQQISSIDEAFSFLISTDHVEIV